MFKLKKFVVFVVASFFMVPAIFAQDEVITKDPSGAYVYETTISSLVNRRIFEEIKLINNSSLALPHVTCTITINGKSHDMRPIPVLKLSDSEGFDGYFEDDMNREFPKYFGKDGKFSRKNNNTVKFTFSFRGHNDDVAITDVYDSEDDLCFVVSDATYDDVAEIGYNTQEENVEPAAVEPVQKAKQPAGKVKVNPKSKQQLQNTPASNNSGDTTVVIEGKTYLIHDGKAYPIQ